MKKSLVSTFALAVIALISTSAFATSPQTAPLDLSVTVINNCTITTTAVAFPSCDPLSAVVDNGTGTVKITCTKNAVTTIELGQGANFLVNRRMLGAGPEYLNYEIYKPSANTPAASCAYTARWGAIADSQEFTPAVENSKAQRSYNVCGQIPLGQ